MFHRFRIGAMEATIVSDGPLVLPRAAHIFDGPGDAELTAVLRDAGQPTGKVHVAQNCLLLETGGKRVLFDNGMGSSKLFGPDSGRLHASLAEAGVDPATIDALVLTHAHPDHCWGTMRDDGAPNFPNATICLGQAEWAFWRSEPRGDPSDGTLAGFRKHLLPLAERMHLLQDGDAFLPGVQAWLTPGHTPGHMAYLFAGGWCLTGDAAFHDPISYRFPDAGSVYDIDPVQGIITRRRVLDRLVHDRLGVIGYHHPWPGVGRVERSGAWYRFVAEQHG